MPGTNSDNPTTAPQGEMAQGEAFGQVREYGLQPIAAILADRHITNHQVVEASTDQLTHKMLAKACRGRYLSTKVRVKILCAVNRITGENFRLSDLFTYR